jgi:ubiquinone biosynthesis accessory factor UbiK
MSLEHAMFNAKALDDLAERLRAAMEASPAKDIEKNIKALLQSGLARLDVVTRAEFEVQAQVLARTREMVEKLEARVAELEATAPKLRAAPKPG